MWRSEDDVLKDIASLNDFGTPEDKDSFKILYSVGRGSAAKKKPKTSEKFIDSRTGEAISLEEGELNTNNTCYKGKGRGSLLGSLFRTKLQLQQQLRLARPLGSGDEAIESYYGRKRTEENVDSIEATNSELVPENVSLTSKTKDADLSSNKIKKRVKATRNSSLQANALIANLLSKSKVDSNEKVKYNDQCEHFYSDAGIDDEVQKKSVIDADNLGSVSSENSSENADEKSENYLNTRKRAEWIVDDNFKIIDDDEKIEEDIDEMVAVKLKVNTGEARNDSNEFDSNNSEIENDRDEKYRALGERLKRGKMICNGASKVDRYSSSSFLKSSAPMEGKVLNDEDFPPLRKS